MEVCMKLSPLKRPRCGDGFARLRQQLNMAVDVDDFDCIPLIELETMLEILSSVIKERKELQNLDSIKRERKRRKTQNVSLTIVSARVVPPSPAAIRAVSATSTNHDLQPEVLRLIANTGFLRSHDLGRFLLMTKKSFVQNLTPNFVFQLLYETRLKDRWASPKNPQNEWIPQVVVGARGHETVLRAMESLPIVKRNIVALPRVDPRPKLNCENTIFIVSFWVLSQKIYSRRLQKAEVDRLTKAGHCRIPVNESIFQISRLCLEDGKAIAKELHRIRQKNSLSSTRNHATGVPAGNNHPGAHESHSDTLNSRDGVKLGSTSMLSDDPLVSAKIHAIRLDTNETCTLYHSNLPRFEMQRTHLRGSSNSNDNSSGVTVVYPIQRALKNTPAGDQLVARWFQGWPEGIQNFGGLTFGVFLQKNCFHIESKVFGATGNQFEALRTRHGVSPFHILEELAGWQ